MDSLPNIRTRIDEINRQLCDLIKERMDIANEVAEAKRISGKAITDPAREREVLNKVMEQAGPEYEKDILLVFQNLIDLSKARQRKIIAPVSPLTEEISKASNCRQELPSRSLVACQGAEGAYSQLAASKLFQVPSILFFNDFEKVFEAVENGLCPYGILPLENSTVGSVLPVYEAMERHNFHIVKAVKLKIEHCLMGCPGATLQSIKTIFSHQQALTQCGNFLHSHPHIQPIPASNTAIAAKELAQSGAIEHAVIASRQCAELYGLQLLAENVSNTPMNYTRFICISKNLEILGNANKFSIMLTLPHIPGSLHNLLAKFAAIKVNLTKLESRPILNSDFEFRFIFDFEASMHNQDVLQLLGELTTDPQIKHFTFLGAYEEH